MQIEKVSVTVVDCVSKRFELRRSQIEKSLPIKNDESKVLKIHESNPTEIAIEWIDNRNNESDFPNFNVQRAKAVVVVVKNEIQIYQRRSSSRARIRILGFALWVTVDNNERN